MPTAAVIGCGDVSVVHFDALTSLPAVQLVAVCDIDTKQLTAAATEHDVPGYSDHLTLLEEARPDAVHICTPHNQHALIAADSLERGVHVILEKPLAHTLIEGQRLVEVAERGSAKIAVCFQNRYNAPVQAMHRLLASGELGRVLGGAATVLWHRTADYYLSRPWRGTWDGSGGGLLMNQAIHTVDLLQWLMGDVTAISGQVASRFLGEVIEVEDTAECVLEHRGGARSVFYATLANVINAPVALDIVTEGATLNLGRGLTVTYSDGRQEIVPERVALSGGRAYWGVSHELLIRDFYSRLSEAEPFWISPREAQKSLRIVKSLYQQTYPDASPPSPDH
jgi:UDP-N-acetyl-2-amino-2-deoxyglucuronate dehydrogenase